MRREFPAKVKAKAFARCGGFCEGTHPDGSRCGLKLQTGRFRYDHRIPDWMGGEPMLDNCQVLGWCCDRPKTAKDQGDIAKVKRVRDRHIGIKRQPKGRPLPGTRASGVRRRMDGRVERW